VVKHVGRVTPEQAFLGPGQPVFGQERDGLKQGGSHLVVQIHRRQLALTGFAEAGGYSNSEFSKFIGLDNG
jgi:hypothetical protein